MGFFHTIMTKPWLAEQGSIDNRGGGATLAFPTEKIFLTAFMVVVTVLFSLFTVAYKMRMGLADWRPLTEPQILWTNTAILILASIAFQMAQGAARRGDVGRARGSLVAAGVLSFGFLIGQYAAWQQLTESGYLVAVNPANAFFYLITALHGLHLLGGLVAWGRASVRAWGNGLDVTRLTMSVELCTMYWHFLLVVWIALFGLLLIT